MDRGVDGTIDSVTERTLNALGQVLTESVDSENDGVFEKFTEYEYNAAGDQVRLHTVNAEGNTTRLYTWTYGQGGLLAGAERDHDGDGVIDWRATYIADENGFIEQLRYDNNGDGIDDHVSLFVTGEFGETRQYRSDDDGDGVDDYFAEYFYEGLRRVRVEVDNSGDGAIDTVSHYSEWVEVPVTAFL